MLKKSITYTNFDGVEITDDLYFHLSTPEITKMSVKFDGDISRHAEQLSKSGDQMAQLDFIEELILSSYGVKSANGKSFVKNKEVRELFEYSAAYAELFEELLTKPGQAEAFGQGLIQGAQGPKSDAARLIAERQAKKLRESVDASNE